MSPKKEALKHIRMDTSVAEAMTRLAEIMDTKEADAIRRLFPSPAAVEAIGDLAEFLGDRDPISMMYDIVGEACRRHMKIDSRYPVAPAYLDTLHVGEQMFVAFSRWYRASQGRPGYSFAEVRIDDVLYFIPQEAARRAPVEFDFPPADVNIDLGENK